MPPKPRPGPRKGQRPVDRNGRLISDRQHDRRRHQADPRARLVVGRHPDREWIEHLLLIRPAYWVEKWLAQKYPRERDGVPLPGNARLRVSRPALIRYRDRFLVPKDQDWREPLYEDSPLADSTGLRAPKVIPMWELEALTDLIHWFEEKVKALDQQDREMGITQQTTLEAAGKLGEFLVERANLAAELGVPGYEKAALRVKMEQRLDANLAHVHVFTERPLEPMRYALAKRQFEMDEGTRKALMDGAGIEDVIDLSPDQYTFQNTQIAPNPEEAALTTKGPED
jgi:hypothetical protein